MNLHANARTCPNSRELLARRVIEERWSHQRAARAAGVSTRTATKWVARYRVGEPMADRSSAPRRVPSRTPKQTIDAIEKLRRLRMTAAEIAEVLGMAISTISRWLKRIGLGKRSRLEPTEPPNRYERKRPGELVHVDVKKLGRIEGGAGWRVRDRKQHYNRTFTDRDGFRRRTVGWEYVHVAVDDATRLAYVEVLHGKAERFIRTMLGGWAYGAIYGSSAERTAALDGRLWRYNHQRPHGSLRRKPPSARLAELNNLLGSYS